MISEKTCPERRAGEPPCCQHCLVSKDYPSGKIFSLWRQKISVIYLFFTTCVLTVSRVLLPTINRHPVNSNHLWWFSVEMKTSHFDFEFLADIYRNIDASILVRIGEPEGILDFTIDTFNLFFFFGTGMWLTTSETKFQNILFTWGPCHLLVQLGHCLAHSSPNHGWPPAFLYLYLCICVFV